MWAKVDDRLFSHPKVAQCSQSAMGLWVKALSWSVCYSRDGIVPKKTVAHLGGKARDYRQLVEAGLWEEVEGGFQFHDWADYLPTEWEARTAKRDAEKDPSRVKGGKASKPRSGRVQDRNRTDSGQNQDKVRTDSGLSQVELSPDSPLHDAVSPPKTSAEPQLNLSPVPSRPEELLRNSPSSVEEGSGEGSTTAAQLALVVDATAPADAAANAKPTRRGTRLPDGWFPDRTPGALKLESTHNHDWLQRELERFADYWQSQAGQRGTKLDWTKTWCNWIRSAEDRQPRSSQQETDAWYRATEQRIQANGGKNMLAEIMKGAQP